jgi:UDP-glucuronate 4-epimerase
MDQILVTGAAGFIGLHTTKRLLEDGYTVHGLDNMDARYDLELKEGRLAELTGHPDFTFFELDLEDQDGMEDLFTDNDYDAVVHLAAQAGVRAFMDQPQRYIDSNVTGFLNVLEGCRHERVNHLVFASSSSVYGKNTAMPSSEHDSTEHPVSLYAATKKSNEMMAHSYADLYDLPVTGLRFFTVYGPWGRPDMAPFLFTKAMFENETIDVYGQGDMYRDFTYVDDVVEGIVRVMEQPASPDDDWSSDDPDPATSEAPYQIYNIGNGDPVHLMTFIETIEESVGTEADKNFMPMQPGDVRRTHADVSDLKENTGYEPSTPISEGIERFVEWYRVFYDV